MTYAMKERDLLKQGMAEGMAKGIAKGMEKGMEKGIRAMIATLKSFALTPDAATERIAKEFDLSADVAGAKVKQYWELEN